MPTIASKPSTISPPSVKKPMPGTNAPSGKYACNPSRIAVPFATTLPRISHDRRTYRLTLRDGIRYSNGATVKASDFKTAVERNFRLDSAGAAFFRNVVGAKAFAKQPKPKRGIRGIEVNNTKRSIMIHLAEPQADFSNVLASEFAAPVPEDTPAADTSLHPLPATGPYEIKSYQPKSRILKERNPYFQAWRFHGAVPAGNPDRVTWDITPDASTALHRVLSGKDDWMSYYQIPRGRLAAIERKHADAPASGGFARRRCARGSQLVVDVRACPQICPQLGNSDPL